MNVKVVYYSKSGNTKKLAECIAEAAGVNAEVVTNGKNTEADLLFLGASVYYAGIDSKVKQFIGELDPSKVKEVVVFSTSALAQRGYPDIKKRLEEKGIRVNEENFYCRGKFLHLHANRPNGTDLANARAFTKKIIASK